MNYNQLKSFIYVVELESFSKASEALYLTQPTVTTHVKSLEKHLNTLLFDRHHKGIALTQSGQILYQHALEIVRLNDQAQSDIEKLGNQVYGDLKMACSLTIGEFILPNILKEVNEHYPLIHVSAEILNTNTIIDRIANHQIDIGLIETHVEHDFLQIEPFTDDELVLISSQGYFDNAGAISLEDLKNVPLILREPGSGTRAEVESLFKRFGLGVGQFDVTLELGSTEAIKNAVINELGVSIISKRCVKKELELGLLDVHPFAEGELKRQFYIASHRTKVMRPIEELFCHMVKQHDYDRLV
ncbi:selenium metabolism-associated LysR family transcriptional regulator [Alkalibacillus aidingensis]|uniref:selenium metabolism-associated LysR family transcriptional regulator n=1 Tax=Alkalibacillus aidingensis TaxID=2747607 RepID=UPI0016607647|nr:selenium metabolism-associated LysR family transcriptional regulator [Alkalibacillus aidingensis]